MNQARRMCWALLVSTAMAGLGAGPGGCTTVPPLASMVEPSLLHASDEHRLARREIAATPLEKRIAAVDADIEQALVPIGDGVLAPHYHRADGRPGPLQVEINTALLSGLAAKHAATGDEHARALGERIIRGLIALDERSGALDGFIAFHVNARTLAPIAHPTNSNVYTQLLFAYVLADASFGPGPARDDIRRHVSLIYRRFLDENFHIRQMDGTRDARTDLRLPPITLNARRALDRRLLDAAAFHLGDDETRELARRHQWRGIVLAPKHIELFGFEVPTASSSWLNLQALTALNLLGYGYERQAISLSRRYARDDNPLFRTLAAMNGAEEDFAAIRRRLEEFPYPATNSGIINSHRPELTVVRGNFVKFNAFAETRRPLPLHDIASSEYLWKLRLRKIDAMPLENPHTLLGYDLHQAYWLLRMAETKRESSSSSFRTRVSTEPQRDRP